MNDFYSSDPEVGELEYEERQAVLAAIAEEEDGQ